MLPVIIQFLEMKASEDSIEAVEVQKGLKVKPGSSLCFKTFFSV